MSRLTALVLCLGLTHNSFVKKPAFPAAGIMACALATTQTVTSGVTTPIVKPVKPKQAGAVAAALAVYMDGEQSMPASRATGASAIDSVAASTASSRTTKGVKNVQFDTNRDAHVRLGVHAGLGAARISRKCLNST